jgi:hypothetical protein
VRKNPDEPAPDLCSEVLPERMPVAGLLMLRGDPGEPPVAGRATAPVILLVPRAKLPKRLDLWRWTQNGRTRRCRG